MEKIIIRNSDSAMQWAKQSREWRRLGNQWYSRAIEGTGSLQDLAMYQTCADECKENATKIESAIRKYVSVAEAELKEILHNNARTHIGRLARSF